MTNYSDLQAAIALFKSRSKDAEFVKDTFDIIRTLLLETGLSVKKVYMGQGAVTGTLDVDLTAEFSVIDRVVASLAGDPVADAMWVSAAKGAVAGHIDLKVWKPTAVNGTSANVTPIAATVAANVNYVVIGTPA
ncbi:MAG: hypothetical protein HWN68_02330 [Desulfobacterales bacterium]|nr:hypothetical protein [Desulfobacterales bacterium]